MKTIYRSDVHQTYQKMASTSEQTVPPTEETISQTDNNGKSKVSFLESSLNVVNNIEKKLKDVRDTLESDENMVSTLDLFHQMKAAVDMYVSAESSVPEPDAPRAESNTDADTTEDSVLPTMMHIGVFHTNAYHEESGKRDRFDDGKWITICKHMIRFQKMIEEDIRKRESMIIHMKKDMDELLSRTAGDKFYYDVTKGYYNTILHMLSMTNAQMQLSNDTIITENTQLLIDEFKFDERQLKELDDFERVYGKN